MAMARPACSTRAVCQATKWKGGVCEVQKGCEGVVGAAGCHVENTCTGVKAMCARCQAGVQDVSGLGQAGVLHLHGMTGHQVEVRRVRSVRVPRGRRQGLRDRRVQRGEHGRQGRVLFARPVCATCTVHCAAKQKGGASLPLADVVSSVAPWWLHSCSLVG